MKSYNNLLRNLRTTMLTLGALTTVSASAFTALDGDWKHHPVFDYQSKISTYPNHVEKIMDGKRFVYFWVNSTLINKGATSSSVYTTPRATLFCVDKEAMGADGDFEVKHVSEFFDTHCVDLQYADYNTVAGYLVAVYGDGNVEVMWDDGRIVRSEGLSSLSTPGQHKVNSMIFDDESNTIYMSTPTCVYVLNPETGVIENRFESGRNINAFARVGEYWVMCDDTTAWEAPVSKGFPQSDDDFTLLRTDDNGYPMWIVGGSTFDKNGVETKYNRWEGYVPGQLPLPWRVLPITGNSFYCVARNRTATDKSGGTRPESSAESSFFVFSVIRGEDGVWHTIYHAGPGIISHVANYVQNSITDKMLHITATGYELSGPSYAYRFRKEGMKYNPSTKKWDTTAYTNLNYLQPSVLSNIPYDILNGDDSDYYRFNSSYEGKRFWFYQPWKGFYYRDYEGHNKASKKSVSKVPNSPNAGIASTFSWNPEYGMLVRNIGYNKTINEFLQAYGDQLSGYKNGKWTSLSPITTAPDLSFIPTVTTSSYRAGVIDNPRGAAVDPLNPDHVYCGSYYTGLTRVNLADPTKLLNITTETSVLKGLPTVISSLEATPGASSVSCFSEPQFDSKNVLWTSRWIYSNSRVNCALWYWLPEDRLAVNTPSDYAAHPMRKIEIKNFGAYSGAYILPLTSKGNENKILVIPNIFGETQTEIYIYDHKGTLDKTSDDTFVKINALRNQMGNMLSFEALAQPVEDNDGRIWFPSSTGIYYLDPADILKDSTVINQVYLEEGSGGYGKILTNMQSVSSIAFDPMGRKWMGSDNGLYCLDSDNKTLVGHFTTENSALQSNHIYGLGWNPETNSLLMSTDAGIEEFSPAADMDGGRPETTKVFPSTVKPDYKGYVTITGVPTMSLSISDSKGKEVTKLKTSAEGSAQWSPNESNVEPGAYYVTDSKGTRLAKITVM